MGSADYFFYGITVLFLVPCLYIAVKSLRKQSTALGSQSQALAGQKTAIENQILSMEVQAKAVEQGRLSLEHQQKALDQNERIIVLLQDISARLVRDGADTSPP